MSDPVIERRFVAAVFKDDTASRLSRCHSVPATDEFFQDYEARKAWRAILEHGKIDNCQEAPELRHLFAIQTEPIGEREFNHDRERLIFSYLERIGLTRIGEAKALLDAESRPQPYTTWTPSQAINFTLPPDAVLLGEGYLCQRELTSLVGPGGLGKSRLTVALGIAQVLGEEWCGMPTKGKPQQWLFLNSENGLRRWKSDFERMLSQRSDPEREKIDAHLRFLALTDGEAGDLHLGTESNRERLKATLRAYKPGVLVFDPFASMVEGDENTAEAMRDTLGTIARIVFGEAPSAAILLVHHSRTGAQNMATAGDKMNAGNFARGSKALFSAVRTEIQLAPGSSEDPNRLVLACGKSNNAPHFETRGLLFDSETFRYSVDPDFDEESWRSNAKGERTVQAATIADVVSAVHELCPYAGASPAKAGAIVEKVKVTAGASPRTIKTRLQEAVRAGYLNQPQRGEYRPGAKPLAISPSF